MSLLLESIRIENRQLHHVDLHNVRFNNARKQLFGKQNFILLEEIIKIPKDLTNNKYKCRITCNGDYINYEISVYEQRKINTLKIVHFNNIDYTFKTDDRTQLNIAFSERENCDDIIIVKNGMVTDAWAANIILFNGTHWETPSTPLLKGVQRENLLNKGIIYEKNIHFNELLRYKSIKLVNAMIGFDDANEIEVNTGIIF